MKKLYSFLVLFILMLSSLNSKAQYESFFGDSLTEWYYVANEVGLGFDIYPTIKISCDSDTTINSVSYKKCRASRISPYISGSFYYDLSNSFQLTEDTTQGLLVSRVQSDTIIFDTICNLSLSVLDTFYFKGGFNFTSFAYVLTTDSIGNKRRLQLNRGKFIEGVGSTFSMVQTLYNSGIDTISGIPISDEILGCHLKDGSLNYKDSLGIYFYFWNVNKIGDCIWYGETGIEEQNMLTSIRIWPNPTQNIFTLDLSELSKNTTFVVYSIDGLEVINQKILGNKTAFNFEKHSKGIYFYQLINGEQWTTGKIVHQ